MSEKTRLVVAGAGAFGREHLRILTRMNDVTIAGIGDIDGLVAQRAAQDHDVADWTSDPISMMEKLRPHGIIVATPGASHVTLASHALYLGIPVLVEKPVAMSAGDARALLEPEARTFVLPGHILRHSNPHRKVAEIVRSGEIGRVLSVTSRRHRDDSHAMRYREDPVLMTMIHDIDLALWLSGAGASDVLALRSPLGPRSETLMMARGLNGATWRLSTAWTFPSSSSPPDRLEVVGERGSVELEAGNEIRCYGPSPRRIDVSGESADQPLEEQLRYFVDRIQTGRKPEVVTLNDAITGLSVADAVIRSLTSGKVESA